MMRCKACGWVLAGFLAWQSAAQAGDHLFVSGGYGPDGGMARIGWQRDWEAKWLADGDWYLGGAWELDGGRWWGKDGEDLWEVGLTPVFRFQRHRPLDLGIRPWVELGIGVHVLSQTRYSDKRLSTMLQFGDHLGAGFSFGDRQQYSLVYRFQHHSNGGIKRPNPGIEFHILQLGYRYK
jgi:lipid A 3-O-deacylase